MTIGALDAANAYGRALGGVSGVSGLSGLSGLAKGFAPGAAPGSAPAGFGAMVEQMVGHTATALRTAESASARQVAGKGDLIDVVTAIGAAETALDTMVAVRDKVVSAYSDIMHMQI